MAQLVNELPQGQGLFRSTKIDRLVLDHLLLQPLGGVDYRVGVLLGAGIVLLYTVIGGFRAVCWTDFVQALLMVGTLVAFPIYLLATQGSYTHLLDSLRATDPGVNPDGREARRDVGLPARMP